MSKAKQVLLVGLACVLVAALAVGGTLAYLTDRDSEVNTFTVGDVKIDLIEGFEQGAQLIPGKKIDKNAEIKNVGSNDAWAWLTVLIPKELGPYTAPNNMSASNNVVHWNYPADNAANIKVDFNATPVSLDPDGDGVNNEFYETSLLYKPMLKVGESTDVMFSTVYLDAHVDIAPNGDWYWVKDGEVTKLDWNSETNGLPKIYVSAHAIQADGFDDVEEAYAAYQTQWGNNGGEYNASTAVVSNLEELRVALAKGGNIVLADDIIEENSDNTISTTVVSNQPDTLLNVTTDTVLDLNGRTISLTSSGTTTGSVINVQNATLEIRGDGKIIGNDDSDSPGWLNIIWAGENAVVNIYGGEFSGRTLSALYSFKNGAINVYDGTYVVNTDSYYYDGLGRWLNVNNSNADARITVYGGTFVNFDFNCDNMTSDAHDKGNVSLAPNTEVAVTTDAQGNTYSTVTELKPLEVTVTPADLATVDFTQDNALFTLSGNFTEDVTITLPEGLTQTIDGTGATFSGGLAIDRGIPHSYDSLNTTRNGKLTVTGVKAETLCVNAVNMESVDITGNTVNALSVAGGNLALNINDNVIDGNEAQYATGNTEHNTIDYGITLRITDYELSVTGNTITDTYSHAIGLNGRQDENGTVGWIDGGANNAITAFSGNTITVNSTKKSGRAALKIWNDKTYAPIYTSGQQPNAAATALMDSISGDTTNVITLGTGHTTFNIYDYKV